MLRRTQPINAKPEVKPDARVGANSDGKPDVKPGSGRESGPYGVDRRRDPRLRFDDTAPKDGQASPQAQERGKRARLNPPPQSQEQEAGAPVMVERRKSERRKMDAMRAELQKSAAAQVQERGFSTMLHRSPGRFSLKPSRIVLLAVALITGGLAAFLATQLNQQTGAPATEIAAPLAPAKIVAPATTKILVAREAIGVGQRLTPISIEWKDWPKDQVRPDYITFAAMSGADGDMSGSVARFEIFPGEPIRRQKLVSADQGYLSAVLERGARAVSVPITAQSASGGFIVPNDHVDVILTRDPPMVQVSQTILSNIKVLAINSRLGETGTSGAPADPNDPLRSMADSAQSNRAEQSGANQAIRIFSPFWNKPAGQVSLQ